MLILRADQEFGLPRSLGIKPPIARGPLLQDLFERLRREDHDSGMGHPKHPRQDMAKSISRTSAEFNVHRRGFQTSTSSTSTVFARSWMNWKRSSGRRPIRL